MGLLLTLSCFVLFILLYLHKIALLFLNALLLCFLPGHLTLRLLLLRCTTHEQLDCITTVNMYLVFDLFDRYRLFLRCLLYLLLFLFTLHFSFPLSFLLLLLLFQLLYLPLLQLFVARGVLTFELQIDILAELGDEDPLQFDVDMARVHAQGCRSAFICLLRQRCLQELSLIAILLGDVEAIHIR